MPLSTDATTPCTPPPEPCHASIAPAAPEFRNERDDHTGCQMQTATKRVNANPSQSSRRQPSRTPPATRTTRATPMMITARTLRGSQTVIPAAITSEVSNRARGTFESARNVVTHSTQMRAVNCQVRWPYSVTRATPVTRIPAPSHTSGPGTRTHPGTTPAEGRLRRASASGASASGARMAMAYSPNTTVFAATAAWL